VCRSGSRACSHALATGHLVTFPSYSSQSRVSVTQTCSGSCALPNCPRLNAPSHLRGAHVRLTRRRPHSSTFPPLRAARRPRHWCPRPSTALALAEDLPHASGKARDDMPELLRKALSVGSRACRCTPRTRRRQCVRGRAFAGHVRCNDPTRRRRARAQLACTAEQVR
jgi:hypothetical protein